MQINSVTNAFTTGSDTINSNSSGSGSSNALTQNDFLQLMVTQMQNQNPLEPQSDTQMAAEMAQFTSLQQSSAMSASLAMIQANSLVGSTVDLQLDSQTSTSGVVQGVVMQNGTPEILVNGAPYTLSQVVAVVPTVASSTSSTPGTSGQ